MDSFVRTKASAQQKHVDKAVRAPLVAALREALLHHRHFGGWLAGFRQRRGFPTLVEFHADDLADAAFLHRHAVQHVGHADGAFVVGDDDEL